MSKKLTISVVGLGMVGGSLKKYFEKQDDIQLFFYDKFKEIGSIKEVMNGEFIYICVPTPFDENKGCDTSIIEEVIDEINKIDRFVSSLRKKIIIKSTVIPGTTERLQKKYPDLQILFNPEFLTEVTADQDTSYPDRQLIGYTKKSYNIAKDVLLQLPLAPFERLMPATEAEMIKYASNCWFATKVTYANQIYDLCQELILDYDFVLEGLAADKRIGKTHLKIFHHGYRGFGGKCLPKDLKSLLVFAEQNKVYLSLLQTANDYNDKLLQQQDLKPLNTENSSLVKQKEEKKYIDSEELKVKDDAKLKI